MGFAINDTGAATAYSATSEVVSVDVTAGDLIVVGVTTADNTIGATGISDDDGNDYVTGDAHAHSVSAITLRLAYCLSAKASGTVNITVTFDAGACRKNLLVATYTPDSGDTVSLDVSNFVEGGWEASPWETSQVTTTGDDEVCVAFVMSGNSGTTYTNPEIPSGTAGIVIESVQLGMEGWYRILSATMSNGIAEIDPSVTNRYLIEMFCFKATAAAAGGLSIPTMAMYYARTRNR